MATDRSSRVSEGEDLTDTDTVIEMRDVNKTFSNGTVVAVEDFNLEIGSDEFVVFLGPSGCGKTTTLRCIAGLEQPDSGSILIDGEDKTYAKPKDRDLAFVFQEVALYPHKTVRENIRFGLDMAGELSPQEKEARVREVASLLGLEPMLDRRPDQLSGGQRQRVSIGRAMVMEPSAFLLDEPFSNLDANLRDAMRVEVKKLQRELERAMVFVTHDQEEALTLGDKIVVMNDARIQQVGTPDEIYNDPDNRFIAEFIGSPSTNLIESTVRKDDGRTVLVNDAFELPIEDTDGVVLEDGDRVTLGIRPEDIDITSPANALFDAEITVIEHLGRDDAVYLSTDIGEIRVVTEFGELSRTEDSVGIEIDRDKIWLFDDTGNRLV